MEILNIHTCRTRGLLNKAAATAFPGYKITRHEHAWNYLEECENVIKSNMNADIYVIEMSTLKYKKGAHNFSKAEYENYLLDIFKLINKKPVFLLFNLNPIISPEHITPLIKSKLNNNNRISVRDWSEEWTKCIFEKYYKGKFKALTGDAMFGKYNESKYIMNSEASEVLQSKPRDSKYEEHAFGGMLDIRHYAKTSFDFLEDGNPINPRTHSSVVAKRHLRDFISNNCNINQD